MTSAFKTNKMQGCFLLILSLMTGCGVWAHKKECQEEWVKITCNHAKTNGNCEMAPINQGSSLRENTRRLTIKQWNEEICFSLVKRRDCPILFHQIAYRTAKTTIRCDNPPKYKSRFLCKENNDICVDILPTQSPVSSNQNFHSTDTDGSFSVSISNVSSQDDGVYWCGVETTDAKYRFSLKQIKLDVQNITNFTRSQIAGENFTYFCRYNADVVSLPKFICKGEDPSVCQPLVTTTRSVTNERFFMNDDHEKKNITITMREVKADDSGTYWCGAESSSNKQGNTFIHRFDLTVVPSSTKPPASTSTAPATTVTTAAALTHGSFEVLFFIVICIAVLLLVLFLIVLILIHKRFSCSKDTGYGAAVHSTNEDRAFEEMQQWLRQPDSETALNTIYVTVNQPNHTASPHYATINFQKSTDNAGDEAPKPRSSMCEYSTVKFSKCPTSSAVSQPSRPAEEPLYATVNKPRKK